MDGWHYPASCSHFFWTSLQRTYRSKRFCNGKGLAMRDRLYQATAIGVKFIKFVAGQELNEATFTDNCFFGGILRAEGPRTIISDQPA